MTEVVNSILYRGMEWSSIRNNTLRAISDTTGGTYIVEPDATKKQWTARFGFPSRAGKPFMHVGRFADADTGILVAERHDFRFWVNSVARGGDNKPIFLGSGTQNSPLEDLGENARNDVADIIADGAEAIDPRVFTAAASFFSAQKTSLKQEKNGALTLTLSIQPSAMPRWLLDSTPGSELLVGAIEIAAAEQSEWEERGQRALKRSFALPADPVFQQWIMFRYDKWRLVTAAISSGTSEEAQEATSETLRRLISCPTRKQLTRDRDAIERIESLDREFYADLMRGFGTVTSG